MGFYIEREREGGRQMGNGKWEMMMRRERGK